MPDEPIALSTTTFDTRVVGQDGTWLVDFWADWCGPCHAMKPVLDEIARLRPSVNVGTVEVTEERDLANRYEVQSLPTLIVFRDGVPALRLHGARTARQLLRKLDGADATDG